MGKNVNKGKVSAHTSKSRSNERDTHRQLEKLWRGLKKRVAVIFNSAYLQVLLWVWLFTVFTFYDPPFARVCHVLFKVFPFHSHMAIFVGTSNNFERASFQVSLF